MTGLVLSSYMAIHEDKNTPEKGIACAKAGTCMAYMRNGEEMAMARRGNRGRV